MERSNMMEPSSGVCAESAVEAKKETISEITGMTEKYLEEAEIRLLNVIEYIEPAPNRNGESAGTVCGLLDAMRDNRNRAERVCAMVNKLVCMIGGI